MCIRDRWGDERFGFYAFSINAGRLLLDSKGVEQAKEVYKKPVVAEAYKQLHIAHDQLIDALGDSDSSGKEYGRFYVATMTAHAALHNLSDNIKAHVEGWRPGQIDIDNSLPMDATVFDALQKAGLELPSSLIAPK